MDLHPSEEHALTLESAHRRILDAEGNAVSQLPLLVPGSLAEAEALAEIDFRRQEEARA